MASPVTFSGMASGIDSAALIKSLVTSAKAPITRMQAEKTAYSSQSKKVSDIKTKLTALQNAAKALDTKSETLGNKVSSSDEKVLKVTAQGGTSMGTYKLEVTSTAQAERTYSNTVPARDTSNHFGSGTLTIQVGSSAGFDVAIDASDTIDSIAEKINASGAEVTAGVFHDGTSYRLQVNGRQTGAANAVSFSETSGLSLGLSDPANEKQVASDAIVKIDGLEIKSASNTLTNAVPGVSINVIDKGTSVIGVDRDADALKTKLDAFVTSYNDVMKTLNAEFASVSGVTKGRDSLVGDSTMQALQSSLRGMVSSSVANGDSKLTTFASIGLSSGRDGTLTLDATKFQKATAADYQGVSSLLAGRTDGTGLMTKVANGVDLFTRSDGTLKAKIDGLAARNRRIDTQIDSMQKRIDKYEEGLTKQYANLESVVGGMNSQMSSLQSIIASM